MDNDSIEFNPPLDAAGSSQVIAQDFDDFFNSGVPPISSGPSGSDHQAMIFGGSNSTGAGGVFDDFYDDWDDDDDENMDFGSGNGGIFGVSDRRKGGRSAGGEMRANGDGMDEEDRRFFEELSKGFSAKDSLEIGGEYHSAEVVTTGTVNEASVERNEFMDNTRATSKMLQASRAVNEGG